jgi:hypothetical protein
LLCLRHSRARAAVALRSSSVILARGRRRRTDARESSMRLRPQGRRKCPSYQCAFRRDASAGPTVRGAHARRSVNVAVSISPRAVARESDAGSPRITWLRHARARMTDSSFSDSVILTRVTAALLQMSVILARGRRLPCAHPPSFSREGAAGVPKRGNPAQDSGRKAGRNVRRTNARSGAMYRARRRTHAPCRGECRRVDFAPRSRAGESHAGSPRFDVASPRSREDDDKC